MQFAGDDRPFEDLDPSTVHDESVDSLAVDIDELTLALHRLAAEARADAAAASRRRTAWLARQAEEEASLVGVLLDLYDRGRAIVVKTSTGRVHRGWIETVGLDFLVLRTAPGSRVLMRLDQLVTLRTAQNEVDSVGDRPVHVEADLATLVRSLGPLRPYVSIIAGGAGTAESICGDMTWAGRDIVAIRPNAGGSLVYVPLAAISELCTRDQLPS